MRHRELGSRSDSVVRSGVGAVEVPVDVVLTSESHSSSGMLWKLVERRSRGMLASSVGTPGAEIKSHLNSGDP